MYGLILHYSNSLADKGTKGMYTFWISGELYFWKEGHIFFFKPVKPNMGIIQNRPIWAYFGPHLPWPLTLVSTSPTFADTSLSGIRLDTTLPCYWSSAILFEAHVSGLKADWTQGLSKAHAEGNWGQGFTVNKKPRPGHLGKFSQRNKWVVWSHLSPSDRP